MKHFNELIDVSQKICDNANNKIANYYTQKYCTVGYDTIEQQLRNYLFVAEESAAYIHGNALALLRPDSQEKEIQTFTENLRHVIQFVQQKKTEESR